MINNLSTILKDNCYLLCFRYSLPKQTSSCTHKLTCAKPNHTNVRSAQSPSPTQATYPNIHGYTWESNLIAAKFASVSSPSFLTCSSTSEHTLVTNLISAAIQDVLRHFLNFPTFNRTREVIKLINHTSAIRATSVSQMSHRYWNTFRSTKNRNISRRTSVSIAGSRTHRKHICRSICKSMQRELIKGRQ